MDRKLVCECSSRYPAEIDSASLFAEIKDFFEEQATLGIYDSVPVTQPYYYWQSGGRVAEYFADKWYVCKVCGCLWEFQYPDFPMKGEVRKFADGKYKAQDQYIE